MVGTLQPLDQKFALVKPDGTPTDYFIRWAQQKQIDIGDSISLDDLKTYLTEHSLREGSGIQFTPSGDLNDSPLIAADVQEILDQITSTRGTILFRGLLGWSALLPGASGLFLRASGPGADPSWAAAGSGSVPKYMGIPPIRIQSGTAFGFNNFGARVFVVPQDCTIYAIAGYCTAAQATAKATPGIYGVGAGGIMGALLAQGPQVTGITLGINEWPLTTPLVVTAGTVLYIGIQLLVINTNFATLAAAGDSGFFSSSGALPNPAGGATYASGSSMSFWAKTLP